MASTTPKTLQRKACSLARKKRSDRFALTDQAVMAPGEDLLTRTTKGPFIDTFTDIQFGQRGRIYFSVETVREMAQAAGLFDDREDAVEKADLEGYNRGYTDAIRENYGHALADAVDRLAFVAGQLHLPVVDGPTRAEETGTDSSGDDARGDSGAVEDADVLDGTDDGAVIDTESSSSKSSRRKGPAGVSANRGNGGTLRI
jgi:hypothetical protein